MAGKDRSNDSLFENSMKMVANIIKLSSFSITKMSLGATGPSVISKDPARSVMDANQPLLPQIPGSYKSQELRMRKQPFSFVKQPDGGNGSSYVIPEDNSFIDGMTSDYIRKFHEKNRHDAHVHETTKLSPYRPEVAAHVRETAKLSPYRSFLPLRAVKEGSCSHCHCIL